MTTVALRTGVVASRLFCFADSTPLCPLRQHAPPFGFLLSILDRPRLYHPNVEWLNMLSLILGAVGVLVGVPALWLAVHAERRARERHDVDWHIAFCEHGRLQVHNRGRSTARKVVAYVETSEGVELTSGQPRDFGPGEEWSTELVETLLRRIGTPFFAHVRVEWETDLGTLRSICHTAERNEPAPRYDHFPDIAEPPRRSRKLFR